MKQSGQPFSIEHRNQNATVTPYTSKGHLVYHVQLKNGESIFLTKTINKDTQEEFWSSVPEGKLELAKEIGKLIDAYLTPPLQTKLF